jgi:hypothetical protein
MNHAGREADEETGAEPAKEPMFSAFLIAIVVTS